MTQEIITKIIYKANGRYSNGLHIFLCLKCCINTMMSEIIVNQNMSEPIEYKT